MPRLNRSWVNEEFGGYHIISRTVGQQFLLGPEEKDYFVSLLLRLSQTYFVDLHSFAVLDNHFHLLVTMRETIAESASEQELAERLWALSYGSSSGFEGANLGQKLQYLHECGVLNVRQRLGSVSRFVQDLKQSFSRYFNRKHGRKGYLWSDRFKGVIVSHGQAQLNCSAYIDLNAVRAGIVRKAEDYRWCSLGLKNSNPELFAELFKPVELALEQESAWNWYENFVFLSSLSAEERMKIANELMDKIGSLTEYEKAGLNDYLTGRQPVFSQGLIMGSGQMVLDLQKKLGRVFQKARSLWRGSSFFTTRALSSGCG